MPKIDLSGLESKEPAPGYHAKFIHTDSVTMAHFEIEAGSLLPEHAHIHEQTVNVIEGEFELKVNGEPHVLTAGIAFLIPPNAAHSGRAITDCRIIDVFCPVREDLK